MKKKEEKVMQRSHLLHFRFLISILFMMLVGCSTVNAPRNNDLSEYNPNTGLPLYQGQAPYSTAFNNAKYAARIPSSIDTHEKMILVDPSSFAWGAYDQYGQLVRGGIATAGADFCADEGKPCRTNSGSFRIFSLGNADCISRTYPIGKGGSIMPYCMFFNKGQSLHGTPDQMMTEQHLSHGCVRMRIPDAEWVRNNFAEIGTKVVVLPYN
jgi:hypothetical protein